jgi:hypothetical protein
VNHGFFGVPGGTFTTFDVQGAGTGSGQGTIPEGNNTSGRITGNYIDGSNVNHGFVGIPGAFTTFDVSGAGTGSGQGTIPFVNDPSNGITGYYVDSSNVSHGFLRTH